MQNPTFEQIIGKNQADSHSALTLLGVAVNDDARLTFQRLMARLVSQYNALSLSGGKLKTYSAEVAVENIDIDTQKQTFIITFDMKLSAVYPEPESSIPS